MTPPLSAILLIWSLGRPVWPVSLVRNLRHNSGLLHTAVLWGFVLNRYCRSFPLLYITSWVCQSPGSLSIRFIPILVGEIRVHAGGHTLRPILSLRVGTSCSFSCRETYPARLLRREGRTVLIYIRSYSARSRSAFPWKINSRSVSVMCSWHTACTYMRGLQIGKSVPNRKRSAPTLFTPYASMP